MNFWTRTADQLPPPDGNLELLCAHFDQGQLAFFYSVMFYDPVGGVDWHTYPNFPLMDQGDPPDYWMKIEGPA